MKENFKINILKEFYLNKFLQNMKYLLYSNVDFIQSLKLSKEINNIYLYKIFNEIEKEV